MENSSDKQITPKSSSSQKATPKNQAPSSANFVERNQTNPVSNIKQLTVQTELYPTSTQLIDQSQHPNNQNSSSISQHQNSTPANVNSTPSKPPLPNSSSTPTHAQNKPPTPLPKEVSAGAASGQGSTKNAGATSTQSNGFQRQNSQTSALGNDPVKLKEKIAQLEAKIKYYESEHNNYQNQLLSQRSQYEQESKRLKSKVEEMTKTLSALPQINQSENPKPQNHDEADEPSQEQILKENETLALEYANQVMSTVQTLSLKEQLAQLWQQNHQYEVKLKQMTDQVTALTKEKQLNNEERSVQQVKPPKISKELGIQSFSSLVNMEFKGPAAAEQASEAMLKLQKKMIELERYLQDKDKVILEQENSLSDLNDQYHELLKSEDSLQSALRVKQQAMEDLEKQIRLQHEQQQLLLEDKDHQIKAKEKTLRETIDLVTEKELEIQGMLRKLREAEEAIKEYRARNQSLEQQYEEYQQQYGQMAEENEQMKSDMEAVLAYKAEIEGVVEEQTQNIEVKNKRLAMTEETLRYREQELDKKEALLRRVTQGADENKKKLAQAEMKLRQITQTTLRDLKVKLKDKLNEIEVLKEMVKSANKQAKVKDIDIQRLTNRIHRLEKMTELGRGIIQDGNMAIDTANPIMEDDAEMEETVKMSQPINLVQGVNSFATPLKSQPPIPPYPRKVNQSGHDPLGLNPINYANLAGGQRSVEDEVQMELLNAQQQRQYSIKSIHGNSASVQGKNSLVNRSHVGAPSGGQGGLQNFRNLKQREIEEAMELDRMLEQERRNQSQDVFAKKYEQRLESYYNNLQNAHQTNMKNNSVGMKGVFGGGGSGPNGGEGDDNTATQRNGNYDSLRYYDGMLPNLNLSKKEQLERELMAEINDSVAKKDKYHTPNIQGKSKIVNKAYGLGNQRAENNYPNSAVRRQNNSKNRQPQL